MSDPIKPIRPEKMRQIEAEARKLGNVIDGLLNPNRKVDGRKIGWALQIFSFEGSEFTYISNAQRDQMIKLFEEAANRLRSGDPMTSSERN